MELLYKEMYFIQSSNKFFCTEKNMHLVMGSHNNFVYKQKPIFIGIMSNRMNHIYIHTEVYLYIIKLR